MPTLVWWLFNCLDVHVLLCDVLSLKDCYKVIDTGRMLLITLITPITP